MNAEYIATALGGHKVGDQWMAHCPAHTDSVPSLSITDSDQCKVLIFCHAGCNQSKVIAELCKLNLWYQTNSHTHHNTLDVKRTEPERSPQKARKRMEFGMYLWRSAVPIADTLALAYLNSRGISRIYSDSLRFHPNLRHPTGKNYPGIVAVVQDGLNGELMGIHRTFIDPTNGMKPKLQPQKMMLGRVKGGAVRLAKAKSKLMVGEGIETCLSAMQATGLPAWAALSATGLHSLALPTHIKEVVILADADKGGEAAACAAAQRWQSQNKKVNIATPPPGLDFNDLLLGIQVNKATDSK